MSPQNDKGNEGPTAAYSIEEWMWGLEDDAPKIEVRNGDMINYRPEWRNVHSQQVAQKSRKTIGGYRYFWWFTLLWGWDFWIGEAIKVPSSQPWWRVSREGNQPVCSKEGVLGWRSICWFFKDEKTKDAVPYCSWQWDVGYFLPLEVGTWLAFAAICLLVIAGVPGYTWPRSLGKDAALSDILQTLDEPYGMVMTCWTP